MCYLAGTLMQKLGNRVPCDVLHVIIMYFAGEWRTTVEDSAIHSWVLQVVGVFWKSIGDPCFLRTRATLMRALPKLTTSSRSLYCVQH